MSEGPFKQWVKSHGTPAVSTSDTQRVCALVKKTKTAYCGRTSAKTLTADWESVTCADCRAAGRADGLTVPEEITKTRRGA